MAFIQGVALNWIKELKTTTLRHDDMIEGILAGIADSSGLRNY